MAVFLAGRAAAMEVQVIDDQIIMSGKVDGGELAQLWNIAAERRATPIRTVVLRNSPGGHLLTALQAGDFIREQGWNSAVSGYCFSACALMFLGGNERAFTDEKQPQLGFHGTYYTETALRGAPGSLNIPGTTLARTWMKRATDGKISDAMLERFEQAAERLHPFLRLGAAAPGTGHGFRLPDRQGRQAQVCADSRSRCLSRGHRQQRDPDPIE